MLSFDKFDRHLGMNSSARETDWKNVISPIFFKLCMHVKESTYVYPIPALETIELFSTKICPRDF